MTNLIWTEEWETSIQAKCTGKPLKRYVCSIWCAMLVHLHPLSRCSIYVALVWTLGWVEMTAVVTWKYFTAVTAYAIVRRIFYNKSWHFNRKNDLPTKRSKWNRIFLMNFYEYVCCNFEKRWDLHATLFHFAIVCWDRPSIKSGTVAYMLRMKNTHPLGQRGIMCGRRIDDIATIAPKR